MTKQQLIRGMDIDRNTAARSWSDVIGFRLVLTDSWRLLPLTNHYGDEGGTTKNQATNHRNQIRFDRGKVSSITVTPGLTTRPKNIDRDRAIKGLFGVKEGLSVAETRAKGRGASHRTSTFSRRIGQAGLDTKRRRFPTRSCSCLTAGG